MDTSAKTENLAEELMKVAGLLSPLMSVLPFKRLEDYLNSFQRDIGGRRYHFDYGLMTGPVGTTYHERVIFVPISETITLDEKGEFKSFNVVNLVFRRCTNDIGYWCIHTAKFDKQDFSSFPTQRRSSESEILFTNSLPKLCDELSKLTLHEGILPDVRSHLQELIKQSLKNRRETIAKLTKLSKSLSLV